MPKNSATSPEVGGTVASHKKPHAGAEQHDAQNRNWHSQKYRDCHYPSEIDHGEQCPHGVSAAQHAGVVGSDHITKANETDAPGANLRIKAQIDDIAGHVYRYESNMESADKKAEYQQAVGFNRTGFQGDFSLRLVDALVSVLSVQRSAICPAELRHHGCNGGQCRASAIRKALSPRYCRACIQPTRSTTDAYLSASAPARIARPETVRKDSRRHRYHKQTKARPIANTEGTGTFFFWHCSSSVVLIAEGNRWQDDTERSACNADTAPTPNTAPTSVVRRC